MTARFLICQWKVLKQAQSTV